LAASADCQLSRPCEGDQSDKLWQVARCGDIAAASALIAAAVPLDGHFDGKKLSNPLLQIAVSNRKHELIELLLAAGADVNWQRERETALIVAVARRESDGYGNGDNDWEPDGCGDAAGSWRGHFPPEP
jgi:hypothetical protein